MRHSGIACCVLPRCLHAHRSCSSAPRRPGPSVLAAPRVQSHELLVAEDTKFRLQVVVMRSRASTLPCRASGPKIWVPESLRLGLDKRAAYLQGRLVVVARIVALGAGNVRDCAQDLPILQALQQRLSPLSGVATWPGSRNEAMTSDATRTVRGGPELTGKFQESALKSAPSASLMTGVRAAPAPACSVLPPARSALLSCYLGVTQDVKAGSSQ